MKETMIKEREIQDFDALSYIGEKVQTLLGHFQKDFVGAISYENLGAKFGGYGSFLPSYWLQTQSNAHEYENHNPKKIHSENKKQRSFVSTCASPTVSTRLAPGKAVPAGNFSKCNNGRVQSEEFHLKSGAMKISNSDQRSSRNLLPQKIAEATELSPTRILQTMTSYPGKLVLSPLSETLINLPEKRKHNGSNNSLNSCKKSLGTSSSAVEKFGDLKKEKSSVANSSDKVGNLRIKNKWEVDTEVSRPCKRMKSEEIHAHENNWASDNAVTFRRECLGSTSLSNKTSGNNRHKYVVHKDITEAKKEVDVLGTSDQGLLSTEKREDNNSVRKRRLNETCESDHQTEKKARISKLGGKDTNGSEKDRKSWKDKDKHNNNAKMAVSESQKVNCVKSSAIDAQKAPNPRKKSENSLKVGDSSSHDATTALKDAKDLKRMADRLKGLGSTDANWLYFEAALKFLQGASLLESGIGEATKHNDNDLLHPIDIYISTAKLCELCANEYEKSQNTAAAALAYKCIEVAYMRAVYSSDSIGKDRKELQKALQIRESPSSASDLDNKNHQAHIRQAGLRVLNFAQNFSFAMEASRKSRIAFTAAKETSDKESICLLKKALDFNYLDVGGLLWLVHKALEATSR